MKLGVFKLGIIATSISTILASQSATAQEANAAINEDVEVISVSGIRGALARSQAVKMDSSSIVESISAEDIGKLPDSSIAESLARLPGLSGERSGGRTSGISIRGFKEDFTGTSLNGRELIGIGDNRGVEYDLYPSEIMTGATIYKTSEADLMVQGIGGTVDLQTVRPLQAAETVTINTSYELGERESDNPDFDNKGHRAAISFNKKFMDETVGVAIALATTESPNNQRNYGVWGYGTNDEGQILPTGISSHVISTKLERDTISAVIQYQPTENLDIVLDVLNIDYSDSGIRRGIIEPFSAVDVVGTGANTTGTQNNANSVLRTDPRQKTGELNTVGLNLQYFVSDNWSVELDAATSKSEKRDLRGESYAGLGRSGSLDPSQYGSREFEMSPDGITFTDSSGLEAFSDPSLLQLAGPQSWGGGMASIADQFETSALQVNGNPFSYLNAQDGFLNYADFSEELTTVKFEVEGNLEGDVFTKIIAGVNYSDRYKDKVNKGFFVTADAYPYSDSIPSSYVYGTADLTWLGLGEVVAYDGFKPYNDGTYTRSDAGFLEPDRFGDTYEVEENVVTVYVKTEFEYAINDMFLVGNVGVQYVETDQSSLGSIGIVGSNFRVCDENSDQLIDESCNVDLGDKYSHVLPSLNLSLEFLDSQFLKLAMNKTISRARIDQMKASGFVKFTQNIDQVSIPNTAAAVENYGSPWSKFTGNPLLRPLESNNFDLSYENYFSEEGYIAIAYFYKDLVNWTRDGNQTIDFTNDTTNDGANYFVSGFHDRVVETDGVYGPANVFYSAGDVVTPPDLGTYSFFEDGLEGTVEGIELTANLPFSHVSEWLDGFGMAATYTYVDAELEDGSRVPGQSDETNAITVYYQYGGFEARIATTDRTEFLTYERGGSNKISEATRSAVTLIDAQISYDFADSGVEYLDGLRVSLSGTNLGDEDEETIDDATRVVSSRRQFGPSYLLNLNYSF